MEKKNKVLIIDDNRLFCLVVSLLLKEAGLEVFAAYNGKDALEEISRTPPNLIILDIAMPYINGFQVCETIRAHPTTRSIPVIFLTAKAQINDIKKGRALGADEYLIKPVDHRKLLEVVRKYLSCTGELNYDG